MNKEYIYKDGKVLVIDENNKKREIPYTDNIDDILIKENIIEEIEIKIKELEDSKNNFQYNYSKLATYYPFITCMFMLLTFPIIGISFDFSIKLNLIYTLITGGIFIPFGALLSYVSHKDQMEYIKIQNGRENELEFLKNRLLKEKEKLEELNNNKTNNKEKKDTYSSKVDSIEELKKLRSYINLYYDLGYNEKKYYNYYGQGKLNNKLKKEYSEQGIKLANEYFEEKGPVLKIIYRKKDNGR